MTGARYFSGRAATAASRSSRASVASVTGVVTGKVGSSSGRAAALVVRGEMWLTVGAETRHLRPGQTFELDAGIPHAERYGDDGAAYWVARRDA